MKEVVRTCVACRLSQDRRGLLRIGSTAGRFVVDLDHRAGGRGVYICKRSDCIEKAFDRKIVDRGLKAVVEPGASLALREEALRYVVATPSEAL